MAEPPSRFAIVDPPKVSRIVAWASRGLRHDTGEPSRRKIQPVGEGFDKARRVVRPDMSSTVSGKSSNCERSDAEMCAIPNYSAKLTVEESSQRVITHVLQSYA